MRRSSRAVLCAVVALISLAGCGGEPYGSSEGASEETREEGTMEEATERLSVRDAVGQMFVVGMGGTEPDYYIEKMIWERNIGGVLLFGHNMKSEAQTEALTGALQELSMRTEPSVPLFVAVDQEGGEISSAPWVAPQPAAARVGARGDPTEARAIAEEMGRQLLRAGLNTDLAPVVDTGFGAAIGTRSFGEDPELVAKMGEAAVDGFEA